MKKTACFLLAFAICMTLATATNAEESFCEYSEGSIIDVVGQESPPFISVGDYIVSTEAYVEQPCDPFDTIMPRLNDFLFTFEIDGEKYSLNTYGSKSFTKNTLSKGYLRLYGILNSDNSYAQVGFCHYDGGYQPDTYSLREVDCGEYFSIYYPEDDFSPYYYYYGYFQSPIQGSAGYYGRIHFYNAEM